MSNSRSETWKPGKQVPLEISGMAFMPDGRLMVAIRRGELWIIENPGKSKDEPLKMKKFADALQDPMGLVYKDGFYFTIQRTELTKIRDLDGDDEADEYITVSSGWKTTGNYHEYSFGPKIDTKGNFWIATNIGIGSDVKKQAPWRGWLGKITSEEKYIPNSFGARSPCGIGVNSQGDAFFSDQQGNWIPAGTLHHIRSGAFYGNPAGLDTFSQVKVNDPEIAKLNKKAVPAKTYPEAIKKNPNLVPPTIWFPYNKMGRSATDIIECREEHKFGPFAGQLFVGDFTDSRINRVFLEKVNGQYQGACFPFREGFKTAVLRMEFDKKGGMYVGMTNRGWSSKGTASYALQRLEFTGKAPFEILKMEASPDGFILTFTKDLEPNKAVNKSSYKLSSYTYGFSRAYGGPEVDSQKIKIDSIQLIDQRKVRLKLAKLRRYYVHELHCSGVTSSAGEKLLHSQAYYTLNEIPK